MSGEETFILDDSKTPTDLKQQLPVGTNQYFATDFQ
jgi:hypothetical protein